MNRRQKDWTGNKGFSHPEEHLQKVIESLSGALDEAKEALRLLTEGLVATKRKGRCLQIHPIGRKKAVFRFLAWCWNVQSENGFFGAVPETLKEEYHLFMVWTGKICPVGQRDLATEITTFGEYVACREGARKMWPEKWKELQVARRSLLGEDPSP